MNSILHLNTKKNLGPCLSVFGIIINLSLKNIFIKISMYAILTKLKYQNNHLMKLKCSNKLLISTYLK